MKLKETILRENSKEQCNKIVQWVGNNEERFNELFHLFITGEYRVAQRAAWPLSYCAITHPEFMKGNFGKLLINLKKPNLHNSIKRNTVRLLDAIEIPVKYEGRIMEICFTYLESPGESFAVKAFSIGIRFKLEKK